MLWVRNVVLTGAIVLKSIPGCNTEGAGGKVKRKTGNVRRKASDGKCDALKQLLDCLMPQNRVKIHGAFMTGARMPAGRMDGSDDK